MTQQTKRPTLTLLDIGVLTIILLGAALVQSTLGFLGLYQTAQIGQPETLTFDSSDNYGSLLLQGVQFLMAWGYLSVRRFDWQSLDFNTDKHTLTAALKLIVVAGIISTLLAYVLMWLFGEAQYADDTQNASYAVSLSFSLVIFSLFNGFYEEVFFLGLMFATDKRHHKLLIIISLLLRFLVHTYQGLMGAVMVMMLGVVFLYFRQRTTHLVPFMLAHAFFDVFGLGLWGFVDYVMRW